VAKGVKSARTAGVNWEYEVDDNVAAKENGWYACRFICGSTNA
jgi:hypothetical protein